MNNTPAQLLLAIALIVQGPVLAATPDALGAAACTALASQEFGSAVGAKVTIDSAKMVAGSLDGQIAHCHVLATIAPSTGVEIQLPQTDWNNRLLFTGCGGLCGVIRTSQGTDALARRYAVATTDMGHRLAPGEDPRAWTRDQNLVEEWQPVRATRPIRETGGKNNATRRSSGQVALQLFNQRLLVFDHHLDEVTDGHQADDAGAVGHR